MFGQIYLCVLVLVLLGQRGLSHETFSCPVANGFFPDSEQCDAYISCKESVAERKFCPEGLFYDDRSIHYPRYPCTYPQDVQCGSRTRTRVKRLPRIGRRR